MQLSTCRFGIKDNRITCAERPNKVTGISGQELRQWQGFEKRHHRSGTRGGAGRRDALFFLRRHPARQRNWLYLSASAA